MRLRNGEAQARRTHIDGRRSAMPILEAQSDLVLLVGRLFYSSLFLLFGAFGLTDYTGAVAYMAHFGLPPLFAALAIAIELGGGIFMLVGYQVRLVALGLAIYALVAALIAHRDFANGAQLLHFMKNMAIVGGSLAFVVSGAGRYSVDGRR
jgi:putative oxidoreductase